MRNDGQQQPLLPRHRQPRWRIAAQSNGPSSTSLSSTSLVVLIAICMVAWQLSSGVQVTTEYLMNFDQLSGSAVPLAANHTAVAAVQNSAASSAVVSHNLPERPKLSSNPPPSNWTLHVHSSAKSLHPFPNNATNALGERHSLPSNATMPDRLPQETPRGPELDDASTSQNTNTTPTILKPKPRLNTTTWRNSNSSSDDNHQTSIRTVRDVAIIKTPIYETSRTMPQWMKDYFAWHREALKELDQLARQHNYQSSDITAHILRRNEAYFRQEEDAFSKSNNTQQQQQQQQQRSAVVPEQHPIQFLILRCNINDRCGGFADRIKPLPVFLAAAAKSHRILLIRWQRPAPLQEFLLPTDLNWTSPAWLEEAIFFRRKLRNNVTLDHFFTGTKLMRYIVDHPDRQLLSTLVLEGKVQDANGGEGLYNELVLREGHTSNNSATQLYRGGGGGINRPSRQPYFDFSTDRVARYNPIYHDIFHSFFQPSPPVAAIIDRTLQSMGLIAGNYVSAHFRARLEVRRDPKFQKEPAYLANAGILAVNCSSHLRPGWPIYYASDSQVSLHAVREYARVYNRSIVTYEPPPSSLLDDVDGSSKPPPNLHIEKAADWQSRPPSDFYATFVDFWVMGSGRCMAYGQGGFGKFAGMLSYDSSCVMDHSQKHTVCEWKDSR